MQLRSAPWKAMQLRFSWRYAAKIDIKHSKYILDFTELWTNKYGVDNVLDNDFCALISRIVYVQDREESSMFFGVSV